MNTRHEAPVYNEFYRQLRDETAALEEISDAVALLKSAGKTEVTGELSTHTSAGDGWDQVLAPLVGPLERIASALEQRNDGNVITRATWPGKASPAAIYALRLLAHVRPRLFDTRFEIIKDEKDKQPTTLRAEINDNLAQMPQEKLLMPMFEVVRKQLASHAELARQFETLFTPLDACMALGEAISLRLSELVQVECQIAAALASDAWPVGADPFDESATASSETATATSARAKK